MQSTATRDDPDGDRHASQSTPPQNSARLRRNNRLLGMLLAGVAIFGFAVVIALAVLLRYGQAHHLIAGL